MEGNREEAMRCIAIAQRHKSNSNLPSALKFAQKSLALYSTSDGLSLVAEIEERITMGGEASTSNGESSSKAKSSGVEEHVSRAKARPGHGDSKKEEEKPKKRDYTAKQVEVVKRVKMCKHHQYYEILSLEQSCTENDVKKAYKKLALALHPDKNGAPGADEAFKSVWSGFMFDFSL
ncbi:hypothetical protein P7C73_g5911, partial [Tremellales sp. Uapishka_1]